MIVGKVIGGLGNQMFQYAFYKYISDIKSVDLRLDINDFLSYSLHQGFELSSALSIDVKTASELDVARYKAKLPFLFKFENKIFSKNILFKCNHFRENKFKIDDALFEKKVTGAYIEGYFQTYKYISKLALNKNHIFLFRTKISAREKILINSESVSIHIRGGDYINNKKDNALFGGICNYDYYQRAIKHIKNIQKNPHFIVFSNDEKYARELLNDTNFTIVNWNQGELSFRDMFLMSQCKHNIIANSSFSWWSAWLNNNKNKVVISPKKWFNNTSYNQDDIIPIEWIRI
ncbi:alpha-1,2-fucosyltransferase [Amylibacter sp.]|nr:alpha-1,2-fucosyltransferase [Amylibacter sp.]